MDILASRVNKGSEEFSINASHMSQLLDRFKSGCLRQSEQGPDKYKKKHLERGKLLASQRISLLLDQGSPFLELLPFAGHENPAMTPGGSVMAGIGLVGGRVCLINANVPTIKGGALNEAGVLKSLRLDEIALENKLPVFYLNESAGADLPQQSKIFVRGGSAFRAITRRSRMGIPSVTIVFGSSTAGGAYVPGMSDYVIMVKNQASAYLAGPPLVKMALNEDCDDESLGGAGMHARKSGLCDYLADNDQDAIRIARNLTRHWPCEPVEDVGTIEEPRVPMEDLYGLIPKDYKTPWDMKEIIARISDGSRFSEFKPEYGKTMVTGWVNIFGIRTGVLANNGVILSEAANKSAHFIQLCQKRQTPLLFLQNITGFMVGTQAEQSGIIKHGAKLINAVSNCQLPCITIMTGASFGAGNYGMCGRSYHPNFLFSWPNAKTAVMGPEQLAGVLDILQKQKAAKNAVNTDEQAAQKEFLKKKIEDESGAFYASSQLWDDGMIDPKDTRTILGLCLSVITRHKKENNDDPGDGFGVFRM